MRIGTLLEVYKLLSITKTPKMALLYVHKYFDD